MQFSTKEQNRIAYAISFNRHTKKVNINKFTTKDVVTARILDLPFVIINIHEPRVASDARSTCVPIRTNYILRYVLCLLTNHLKCMCCNMLSASIVLKSCSMECPTCLSQSLPMFWLGQATSSNSSRDSWQGDLLPFDLASKDHK